MVAGLLLAAASTVWGDAAVDPWRLDPRIRPLAQSVHLCLDPVSNTYTGLTQVELEFAVPTNRFVFHARAMDLGPTTLNGVTLALTTSTNPPGWVTAVADAVIPMGIHRFESRFTNNFNLDGAGLYKAISEGRPYLFTQFQATDARQAFPCWDEPGFKIPWRITVTAPEGVEVIGNVPVAATMRGDGVVTHEFGRTPPMPSYLVALAVGPLESTSIAGQSVPGRVITPVGKVHLAGLARKYAPPIVTALEHYFGIPLPYPKLDHLAVPAFNAGAMENAGAITYRDGFLLLEEDHAALEQRQFLVMILAHEIAHMWFGNLVTLRWWDDLWLNEAFATWASLKVGAQLYPDLRFDLMGRGFRTSALEADVQPSVKGIRRPMSGDANVREVVDWLTYFKGMAILNAAESWLGEEAFREALKRYFRRHAWGNAHGEDLWSAFAESGDPRIPEVLRGYVEQPGIPEVSLRRLGGNRLEVRQRRYRSLVAGEPVDTLWQVPLVMRYGVGSEIRIERRLLTQRQEVFEIPDLDRAEWLHPNAGESGYYLWSLDPDLSAALRNKGWMRLEVLEQLGWLQSADFAVASGILSPVEALRLALAAGREPRAEVRVAVSESVVRWRNILPISERAAYAPFLRRVLRPMLDGIGFEPRQEDSLAVEGLRRELLMHLGILGEDPEVISFCRRMAHRGFADPTSVPAAISAAALSVATWHGDQEWSDLLRRSYETADRPDVRALRQSRLAAFRDPALAQHGMDYALTDAVPAGNVREVLGGPAELAAVRLAWLERNYSALKAKISADGLDDLPTLFQGADPGILDRVREFFLDPSRRTPLTELRLREVEDGSKLETTLRQRQVEGLRSFLREFAQTGQ